MTPKDLQAVDISLGRYEWTLYALNLFVGLPLEDIRLFDKPSRERPGGNFEESCRRHGDWTPYPIPHTPIDWHPDCHFLAFVSLAEKATLDESLFEEKKRTNTEETRQRFEKVYQEVEAWAEGLPPCMRLHETAMPHVIALQ